MEGLFLFLDLPNEKQALVDKLRQFKEATKFLPPRDKKKSFNYNIHIVLIDYMI